MKKYRIIVNGTEYEVLVELVSDNDKPAATPAPAQTAEEGAVKAPLTGTVTSINVKAGDKVKKGQVLMILEAMKMENEILATRDGTVVSVSVGAGTQVDAGTALCVIGR